MLAGDALTGVTIMQMEAGLDTGPMIATAETPVAGKTAGELTAELAELGAASMADVIAAGRWTATPQPAEGVTLAPKIAKAEAALDFRLPAIQLERAVRAFNPAPGAFCTLVGERLKILAADVVPGTFEAGIVGAELIIGTGDGALLPTLVQRAGKPAMATAALLNGWSVPPGTRVGVTTRFRITVEFDGRPFAGWQRQDGLDTVQGAIEAALFAISGEQVAVHGAGRTDAGVHAAAMVAHFDLDRPITAFRLSEALNARLRPLPVAVLACSEAPGFHARFDCTGRRYRYRIVNRRAPLTFDQGLAWQVAVPLDADAMHDAAQQLVGRHDFTTFRSAACQSASPVKTLDRLDGRPPWRGHHHYRGGAVVPAPPGAVDDRLPEAGWRRRAGRRQTSRRRLRRATAAALGLNAPPDGLFFVGADYG